MPSPTASADPSTEDPGPERTVRVVDREALAEVGRIVSRLTEQLRAGLNEWAARMNAFARTLPGFARPRLCRSCLGPLPERGRCRRCVARP